MKKQVLCTTNDTIIGSNEINTNSIVAFIDNIGHTATLRKCPYTDNYYWDIFIIHAYVPKMYDTIELAINEMLSFNITIYWFDNEASFLEWAINR